MPKFRLGDKIRYKGAQWAEPFSVVAVDEFFKNYLVLSKGGHKQTIWFSEEDKYELSNNQ